MSEFIRQQLMLPGPTPIPASVLQRLSTPMINHRGEAWGDLYREVEKGVQWLYQTANDVFTIPGSGTAGMETAVVNMLSPGDKVLALVIGVFGDRFAQIAEAYGADVERMEFPFGQAVDIKQLEKRLKADTHKEIKAVLVTHNETSTSVLNPLEDIGRLIHEHGALSIVDAISGLVSTDLPVDLWNLDVVVGGSQKAFMIPPGLAFISVSEKAWDAYKQAKMPRFYFDLQFFKEFHQKGQTPWTPPISLYFGLQESLHLLQKEGLQGVFKRHYEMMQATRAGAKALGMNLLVENEDIASRAVTSIQPPEGLAADEIRNRLYRQYNIVLAGGQRVLKGKIFRIGHLGYQGVADIFSTLSALEVVLKQMGHPVELGSGVAAAQQAVFRDV